jgi:putative FmdB family regulatory protein
MPTYEYVCTRCGQHVEVFQRLSEAPLQTCGVCGGPLRKVFHPAGIVFKGSGFYATDSRAKPKAKGDQGEGAKKDTAAAASSSASESSGSDGRSGSGSRSGPGGGSGSGRGSGSGGGSGSDGGSGSGAGSGGSASSSKEKTS